MSPDEQQETCTHPYWRFPHEMPDPGDHCAVCRAEYVPSRPLQRLGYAAVEETRIIYEIMAVLAEYQEHLDGTTPPGHEPMTKQKLEWRLLELGAIQTFFAEESA